eukprot:TRINITY_DN2540_c0_g2_i1.p1 TRINITY_DN2540_c0_g2~~TRINITY_DN2540_c0_g2_i1.p1  ORF type:complete len:156 (-),score=3.15 TRINITY_DN2540_c0_g2_i1:76-543(-)
MNKIINNLIIIVEIIYIIMSDIHSYLRNSVEIESVNRCCFSEIDNVILDNVNPFKNFLVVKVNDKNKDHLNNIHANCFFDNIKPIAICKNKDNSNIKGDDLLLFQNELMNLKEIECFFNTIENIDSIPTSIGSITNLKNKILLSLVPLINIKNQL